MLTYQYRARSGSGEALSGTMEAESADMVAQQLLGSGITPIDIQPQAALDPLQTTPIKEWLSRLRPSKVSLDELVMLSRQLHTLMRAGIPIDRGLSGLIASLRNPSLRQILQTISDDIQGGLDLAGALARHPRVFSQLFVNIVRVGEGTGRLDEAFLQIAEYLELEKETRDHIKTALRYPTIVLAAMVIAMVIINLFVIPAFSQAFARFGAELPLATRWLLGVSEFTVEWWRLLLFLTVFSIFGFRIWLRTDQGRDLWDRFLLRVPIMGVIVMRATLARFTRALSMSMRSGVPLVQALTVIAGVVDNIYIGKHVLNMRKGIESGESISRTAAATGLFTPLVLQMIAVGEETGAMDELLLETAEYYEREVRYDLRRLSDLIEPIIIVIIGILVLILALGVFLPMWDLSTAANQR